MTALDSIHAWAVQQPALRIVTIVIRVLLALAFVPSGLVKILGHPFTQLPVTDPVGAFFAGFFTAHGYYRFIGIAQWVAAGLLLAPRTATIGAAVYLPIILNIAVITMSLGPSFGGTRFITGAMLLGNLYLLAWDWDRWRPLFAAGRDRTRHGSLATTLALLAGAGLGFVAVTSAHVARLQHGTYRRPLALGLTGALIATVALARMVGEARRASEGARGEPAADRRSLI